MASRVLARLLSASLFGIHPSLVDVEVDVTFGLPTFTMVGLPDSTVRESRDRVRSAIRNSGFEFPAHRITINLAPADLRKTGTSYDLPIAVGVLAASGVLTQREYRQLLLVGELSLDGTVQSTRGVLPMALLARDRGLRLLASPTAATEVGQVPGLEVGTVRSLAEVVAVLEGRAKAPPAPASHSAPSGQGPDMADVRGQQLARRALEIAAAGRHNLLLVGPPGAGKTMMARRLPGILPPPSFDECVETSTIHSVLGLMRSSGQLLRERPFRSPHHSISDAALIGGGREPRPGEVSLAHNGVLFLDEVPEFDRRVLEVLRQPVEEGVVRIARASGVAVFPAKFLLVAAMNPCPCGYSGDPARECRCTPHLVDRYHARLSGPLRDRLDLVVPVGAVPATELMSGTQSESSATIRARVLRARQRQLKRYASSPALTNADLQQAEMAEHCRLDPASRRLVARAISRFQLSARGYNRVRRVARTLADLDAQEQVTRHHVAEALSYRGIRSGH